MALLKRKRSGLNDPMSVVTRFVNACNRHDADSVAACLHPDFDSIQPMYPARNFRGADQVRRNWQAIFDAEPGFRLTVLRQAAADDTVWLELHGAGRDAEVAGVFVMGIQGDRVRWARIYSALIEAMPEGSPEGVTSPPATLREVPPLGSPVDGDQPAPAEEAAEVANADDGQVASVVDIDGGGRSRRRRSSRRRAGEPAPVVGTGPVAEGEPVVVDEPPVVEAGDGVDTEPPVDVAPPLDVAPPSDAEPVEPPPEPEPAGTNVEPDIGAQPEPEVPEPEVAVDAGEPLVMVVTEEPVVLLVDDEPEGATAAPEPDAVDVGDDPEAVLVVEEVVVEEPAGMGEGEVTQAHDVLAELEPEAPADEPPPEVAAAAELLEEREPDVVAEPEPAPVVSEGPHPEPEELVAPTRPGRRRGWKKR